jgi:hypothetical protein
MSRPLQNSKVRAMLRRLNSTVAASLRSAAMTELSYRSYSEFVAELDLTVWKTTRIPEYMHCLER